jgi:AcrR family transcriptional regulator
MARKKVPVRKSINDESQPHIKDRLVEIAARHFAEHGLQGASQRAIQRDAGVNISTTNYYFGSKKALYRAVIEAALSRIQQRRISGLECIPTDLSINQRLRALLDAYLGSHIREAASESGYNYLRIVASLNLAATDATVKIIEDLVNPVRELYVNEFAKMFPGASRNRVYHVLWLSTSLMSMAPMQLRRTSISNRVIERIVADVVTIAASAFETLCRSEDDLDY